MSKNTGRATRSPRPPPARVVCVTQASLLRSFLKGNASVCECHFFYVSVWCSLGICVKDEGVKEEGVEEEMDAKRKMLIRSWPIGVSRGAPFPRLIKKKRCTSFEA